MPRLTDKQLDDLVRAEEDAATISTSLYRIIKNSGVSYAEIANRALLSEKNVKSICVSPAYNASLGDLIHVFAAIGLRIRVDVEPITPPDPAIALAQLENLRLLAEYEATSHVEED